MLEGRIIEPFSYKMSNHISLKLYPDTRPHNLEISALQKGLVLLLDDEELIEEGTGFGVPVVIYADRPYFPGSAEIFVKEQNGIVTLTKLFYMDLVSKKRILNGPFLSDALYSPVHRTFHRAYTRFKRLKFLFDAIMLFSYTVGLRTQFVMVDSRGVVRVNYGFLSNEVQVEVDFSGLNIAGCKEILIMNEQGASFFRKYQDKSGLMLLDGNIGGWMEVKAEEALISELNEALGFSLKKLSNSKLYSGREKVGGRFSWIGLGYALKPHSTTFSYTIKLVSKSD